jgi:iron complex transport system substrate-binding protein
MKPVMSAVSVLLTSLALAQAFPLTIKHEAGTLELAAPARRVVVLEYSFLDTLLALGLKPVGAAIGTQGCDRGPAPYLKPLLGGVNSIGARAQPSLEAILAARPDLILADAFVHKDLLPQLQRIAPTAAFQSRRGSYDDLMQQVLWIGRMVGKEALARTLVADQERLLAKARSFADPRAPGLVAAVATPSSLTLHSSESFISSLLERLGRKNLVKPQNDQSQFEVTLEGLLALNPPTLVLFTAKDENPITREWAKNPLWQNLEAVKRGRVWEFDRDLWTRSRGPLALKLIVAECIDSGLLADRK